MCGTSSPSADLRTGSATDAFVDGWQSQHHPIVRQWPPEQLGCFCPARPSELGSRRWRVVISWRVRVCRPIVMVLVLAEAVPVASVAKVGAMMAVATIRPTNPLRRVSGRLILCLTRTPNALNFGRLAS